MAIFRKSPIPNRKSPILNTRLAQRFMVPKHARRKRRLSMNRHPHPALSQWERVPGGRVRATCPAHRFMAPMRVQSWRSKLSMNRRRCGVLALDHALDLARLAMLRFMVARRVHRTWLLPMNRRRPTADFADGLTADFADGRGSEFFHPWFMVPKRVHRTSHLSMSLHPHPALSPWERVPGGRVRENCPAHRFLVPKRVQRTRQLPP